MISYEYETTRSYNYDNGPQSNPVTNAIFTGADFAELKEKRDKLHNGARGYCLDWEELSDSVKSKIPGKFIIYDASADKWRKL